MLRTGLCAGLALSGILAGYAWGEDTLLAERYAHTATALTDGRILVYGGLGLRAQFADGSEIIDTDRETVSAGPRGHKARAFHTATLLEDGTVLLAGGFIRPYSTSRTAELFDGKRLLFIDDKMSAPRELHAATLLDDGRVLITGGFVGGVTSLPLCDLYDPRRRRFEPAARMQQHRFGHAASRLQDGRVLVTGGSQFPGDKTLDTAELYDPETNCWSRAGTMHAERSRHTATVLEDGRVFITGGNSIRAKGQLASTEFFDPKTGEFTTGPDMAEPRMDHTATLLPEGKVLITGGFNGVGEPHTLDSCEVFDPRTNRFQRAPSLTAPVHEQKATLLPSGEVLVSGGLMVRGPGQRTVRELVVVSP